MQQPFQSTNFDLAQWQEQLKTGVQIVLTSGKIITVRFLQQQDIDNAFHLEKASFSDAWPRSAFQLEVDDPQFRLSFVGYVEQSLATFMLCYHILDELHINNLAVAADYRNEGIASSMLWLVTQIGIHCGVRVSHLEVRRSNIAAITLYEKFGYKVTAIRKKYYEPDNEDAFLMTRIYE
jgi:[ribosomal protein S18]-alanine N-acetyltransferase